MTRELSDLDALINLAKEPSSEKRRELLRQITDIFLVDPAKHSTSESDNFDDIMLQLSYDLEVEVREELSARLASNEYAPQKLMQTFAADVMSVAETVLKSSPVLSQEILIEIAKEKSQEHLMAITKRNDIGEQLSDALVENGDDDTVVSLLNNHTAIINEDTSKKVATRAQTSEKLQQPMIDRPDVPQQVVASLYKFVAKELQEKILGKCNEDEREALEPELKKKTSEFSTNFEEIRKHIDELVTKGKLTEGKMVSFLNMHKGTEFLFSLAKLADVKVEVAKRIIDDMSGKSLIIVCKANNFSTATFKTIAMSPLIKLAKHPSDMVPLIAAYNRFSIVDAQRVMRFWRTRQHALNSSDTSK